MMDASTLATAQKVVVTVMMGGQAIMVPPMPPGRQGVGWPLLVGRVHHYVGSWSLGW